MSDKTPKDKLEIDVNMNDNNERLCLKRLGCISFAGKRYVCWMDKYPNGQPALHLFEEKDANSYIEATRCALDQDLESGETFIKETLTARGVIIENDLLSSLGNIVQVVDGYKVKLLTNS